MPVVTMLERLRALGQPGGKVELTEDPNLRLPQDDRPLPASCIEQIDYDRTGFIAFAPYLYLNTPTLDGEIVWMRDMGPGYDLRRLFPDRTWYRYAPASPGRHPEFQRLGDGTRP